MRGERGTPSIGDVSEQGGDPGEVELGAPVVGVESVALLLDIRELRVAVAGEVTVLPQDLQQSLQALVKGLQRPGSRAVSPTVPRSQKIPPNSSTR